MAATVTSPETANTSERGALLRDGRIWLLGIYWLLMFVGTHLPRIEIPGGSAIVSLDKVLHFAGYLGLTLLLSWIFLKRGPASPPAALGLAAAAILLCVGSYGAFDEVTQLLVGRSCEWLDWLADLGGAITALLIALAVVLWRSRTLATRRIHHQETA